MSRCERLVAIYSPASFFPNIPNGVSDDLSIESDIRLDHQVFKSVIGARRFCCPVTCEICVRTDFE